MNLQKSTRPINESRNMIFAREAAKAFFNADLDGDRRLTFEEFVAMASHADASDHLRTMSMQDLRRLFDMGNPPMIESWWLRILGKAAPNAKVF